MSYLDSQQKLYQEVLQTIDKKISKGKPRTGRKAKK